MCLSKQTLEILSDIKQKHEKDSKLMDINDKQLMLPSMLNDDDVKLNVFGCRADYCILLHCCFTSTEARWLIRDGDRVGRGRQSEGSNAETVRKRQERPWTAARTMEVSPRHCAATCALRNCCFNCCAGQSLRLSVAVVSTNNLDNSKQKTPNLLSPAPPPYS